MSKITSNFGQRILPSLIDEIAEKDPKRPYVSIPRTSNPQDGYRDISFLSFARSINRCSRWIEEQIGRGEKFETLAYMGPQDLMYAILVISSIKTGYKARTSTSLISLVLTDRNSVHRFFSALLVIP